MPQQHPTPLGITVKDAATLTGLSEWEIRKAINELEIPTRKRGRRLSIEYPALVEWFHALPSVADNAS
jgi:hypothetical protein